MPVRSAADLRLLPARVLVVLAGGALAVAALGFRAAFGFRGWFTFDDVTFLTRVNGQPLTADLLLEGYGGHLMPGGFLLTWLFGHDGSLNYTPYAVTLLIMQALAFAGALALLCSLFGARWGVLVPYAIYVTSAISLPAYVWWAAGVNQIALQIALGWGLLAHVAYLRTRQVRWLVTTVLVMVCCLAFYEKVLLVYGAIAIVTVAYFCSGSWRDRTVQLWRRHRLPLLVHGAVGAAYVATYAALAFNFGDSTSSDYPVGELAGNLIGRSAVPALFGGPLTWSVLTGPFQLADPPALFTLLAWLALIGLVAYLHQHRTRSLRAWTIPLWFVLCNLLLLGAARAIALGAVIGLELRYLSELSLAAAIALGLASMRLRGSVESAEPRTDRPLLGGPELVATATVLVCLMGTFSSQQYADHWIGEHRTQDYFDNADQTLGTPENPTPLVNVSVPQYIMWGYEYPANTTRYVLHSFADRMTFPEVAVDNLYVIDDSGRVAPMGVTPLVTSKPPDSKCGYRATATRPARVPMVEDAEGDDWWVRTSLSTTGSQTLEISAGSTEEAVEVSRGLHNVYLHVPHDFDTVVVRTSEGSDPVCVYEAAAGFAVPFGSGTAQEDE